MAPRLRQIQEQPTLYQAQYHPPWRSRAKAGPMTRKDDFLPRTSSPEETELEKVLSLGEEAVSDRDLS